MTSTLSGTALRDEVVRPVGHGRDESVDAVGFEPFAQLDGELPEELAVRALPFVRFGTTGGALAECQPVLRHQIDEARSNGVIPQNRRARQTAPRSAARQESDKILIDLIRNLAGEAELTGVLQLRIVVARAVRQQREILRMLFAEALHQPKAGEPVSDRNHFGLKTQSHIVDIARRQQLLIAVCSLVPLAVIGRNIARLEVRAVKEIEPGDIQPIPFRIDRADFAGKEETHPGNPLQKIVDGKKRSAFIKLIPHPSGNLACRISRRAVTPQR